MSQTDGFTNQLAAVLEECWKFILWRAGVEPRPVTGVPRGAAPQQPSLYPLQPVGQKQGANGPGNQHGLLTLFCCYQGSYALDYSLTKVALIIDAVPNACLLTVPL